MIGRKKILVIDDEEDFCFFLKKNLENTGEFIVFTAGTGEDGIRLCRLEKPDLILLDVMMPKMSGPDVAEILREDTGINNIPLIFLTAVVTKEEIGGAPIREIGGQNYIAKPIEIENLVKTINKVLQEKAAL